MRAVSRHCGAQDIGHFFGLVDKRPPLFLDNPYKSGYTENTKGAVRNGQLPPAK